MESHDPWPMNMATTKANQEMTRAKYKNVARSRLSRIIAKRSIDEKYYLGCLVSVFAFDYLSCLLGLKPGLFSVLQAHEMDQDLDLTLDCLIRWPEMLRNCDLASTK